MTGDAQMTGDDPEARVTLERWIGEVCAALDLDPAVVDRDLLLDLARDAAHGVARPAAPLTTFLIGLAAGRDGADAESIAATVAIAAELLDPHHEPGPNSSA